MKQHYIIAGNVVSVSAPVGLPAWEALQRRFRPFAASPDESPVLEAAISVGTMPECDAEVIYAPVHGGIGVVSARASRLSDGCVVMEFRHIAEQGPRMWMKMPPRLNRAEILIAPGGDSNDILFLGHALMVAYMLATCHNGTLMIHASSVVYGGKAYLFQGKSGTGKSTHASLWTANIPGAELLNDDNPVIRITDSGEAVAYGSPWSGKTHCYRNVSAPIGAFVRIVRANDNVLHRLTPLKAYASLTTSVFYIPFLDENLREVRHRSIERLVGAVPCCEMHCRPDADAARTCMHGVTNN